MCGQGVMMRMSSAACWRTNAKLPARPPRRSPHLVARKLQLRGVATALGDAMAEGSLDKE